MKKLFYLIVALMLVPAAVIAHFFLTRKEGIREVLAVAAWLAVFLLLLVPYAGGMVGAYGYVGAHPAILPALALVWTAAIGAVVWLIARLRGGARKDPEPVVEASTSEKTVEGCTKWVPPTADNEREG